MDRPARVLLVEDERITALDLARRLTRLGYAVVGLTGSGPQAVRHALTLRPHVVLMDIHLEGPMDGIEAARLIQAAAPVPVVYLSAHADAATAARIHAATRGAALVSKPVHLPALHATLQQVLAGRHDPPHP